MRVSKWCQNVHLFSEQILSPAILSIPFFGQQDTPEKPSWCFQQSNLQMGQMCLVFFLSNLMHMYSGI